MVAGSLARGFPRKVRGCRDFCCPRKAPGPYTHGGTISVQRLVLYGVLTPEKVFQEFDFE